MRVRAAFILCVFVLAPLAVAQEQRAISLRVDATEAARRVFRASMEIPAKAGPLTLVYPKWIPGTHSPSNPVNSLVGLKLYAGEKALAWRRDAEDMYAFHVEVPEGASGVRAEFSFAGPTEQSGFRGVMTTAKLAVVNWWSVVLYPKGLAASEISYSARVKLPRGWKSASALRALGAQDEWLEFEAVSLETLIDSPVLCGEHFRSIPLSEGKTPAHVLHLAADSESALKIQQKYIDGYRRLVVETPAMMGAAPYRKYDFLVALSDEISHGGLEHHESSDNRMPERSLVEEKKLGGFGELLPHELAHAWNGKFKRPGGMATPDYHHAMHTELVWVYEGLTSYLGYVLACRSGLVSVEAARDRLAMTAAHMESQAGRAWRSLHDTAVSAPVLMGAPHEWRAWRRGTDFYPEGLLIWLEVDSTIRKKTGNAKSLDDFCRAFFGGSGGVPRVVKYELDDLVAALNEVVSHDWKGLIEDRVKATQARAPLAGMTNCGWRVGFKEKPTETMKESEASGRGGPSVNLAYSGGLILKPDGAVTDVVPGSAADRAGVSPGMKVLSVNGRRFSADLIKNEIAAKRAVSLEVENEQFFKTVKVEWTEGLRYPHLEREGNGPDLLAEILKARVTAPAGDPAKVSAPAATIENKQQEAR